MPPSSRRRAFVLALTTVPSMVAASACGDREQRASAKPRAGELQTVEVAVEPAGADAWRCRHASSTVRLSLRAQGPSTRLRLGY